MFSFIEEDEKARNAAMFEKRKKESISRIMGGDANEDPLFAGSESVNKSPGARNTPDSAIKAVSKIQEDSEKNKQKPNSQNVKSSTKEKFDTFGDYAEAQTSRSLVPKDSARSEKRKEANPNKVVKKVTIQEPVTPKQVKEKPVLTPEEERAKLNCIYAIFYRLIVSPMFNFIIYIFIFCSSLTLSMYTYDQTETSQNIIEVLDYSYTTVFVIEMICKLIGLGPKLYVKDAFNILDALIVLLSVGDIILFATLLDKEDGGAVVNATMALRLLRVMRLARIWKQFQKMLN